MLSSGTESFAKDAIIAWFRGEFAAANAIIDALCKHLTLLEGENAADYASAFAAIHRRRLNWIPILEMQQFFTIADVMLELEKVRDKRSCRGEKGVSTAVLVIDEDAAAAENGGGGDLLDESFQGDNAEGSEGARVDFCGHHDKCEERRAQIKITKGFTAREPVRGNMVNVVRGLKLCEDIFTDDELSKLNDFLIELRMAGQNGELSGNTFISYDQKNGKKREFTQFGVSIFGQMKGDAQSELPSSCCIEPIPTLLQGVIDHLIQWHLLPESRKPNGCIVNFFDEGEYSQPFVKPPHLEQPVSTLFLSDSTTAFGRTLISDGNGRYKGSLMLPLKTGSLLVMSRNSSEMATHAVCSTNNKRVSISFFRVRTAPESSVSKFKSAWKQCPVTYHEMNDQVPKWTTLSPLVMLAPVTPSPMSHRLPLLPNIGTGFFLPWAIRSRKGVKHLPPRARRQ